MKEKEIKDWKGRRKTLFINDIMLYVKCPKKCIYTYTHICIYIMKKLLEIISLARFKEV